MLPVVLGLRQQVRPITRASAVASASTVIPRPSDAVDRPVPKTSCFSMHIDVSGPTILPTRGTVAVPYAKAPIARAPPASTMPVPRQVRRREQHVVGRIARGVAGTTTVTLATCAGMADMSTLDG
jgi:hypothetical protein